MIGSLSFGSALTLFLHLAPGPVVTGPGPVDSIKTFKYVRSAQASFESFRRTHLPRGESIYSHDCDVHVGRFCYWRGDEDDSDPPIETPSVKLRRLELIQLLDSASALLPGDQWIAGQRVRYLVEAERTDAALAAARDCRADAWWCAALGGYAAHVGERFATADSLYEIALSAMPSAQRCAWMDLHDVVGHDLDRALKGDCARREAVARRMFWLGAPMWSVSQSDLLTEHLARLTQTRIAERSASAEGVAWADDIRALVLRYGWSKWFTRADPSFGLSFDAQVTGHDEGMAYYFFPSRDVFDRGPQAAPEWELDNARAVSGYAPSYAKTVHQLTSQIASFRRGDSTLVVAAWDVRKDSTLVGRELDVGLVLAAPSEIRATTRLASQRAVGHVETTALLDSGWLSLELLARNERRAGRMRVGLPTHKPTGRIDISDLLLYTPTDAPVYDLSPARDSALGNAAVPFSRALGVFWETYGIAPQGENARFSLSVEQVEIGWMQRAAERLRFSDPTTATRVQWQEFARTANGISGRGVRIDLSRLRAGKYRLMLEIETDDGAAARAERTIEVRDR